MHFCKILPKDLVMEQGRGYCQKPSGTGPYQFRHWVRDNHLEIVGVQMERYPGYFEGIPNIEFVEFCPFYQMEDFIAGDIHAIPVISDRLLQLDYQIFRDGSIYPFFLGMSCHLVPLDDPQVRRAIAVGINKPEIVRATHEARYHRQLLHSFIPPKLPGFFLTDEINTYNLTDARSHLKEAGYISEKKLPDITLMMEHPRTDFKHRFFVELRRQLDALGIELKEKYYRRENEVRNFRKPYLILRGQLLDFPGPEDIIRTLFATDSPGNLCRFSNAELDRLLQTAEQEKSWNERNKQFLQIQKILSLNMPAVPLFSQQNRVAVQPFIRGIVNPPLGFYYIKMKNVRIER
jgi:ABC-type transport system substrate-binding protein